MSLSVESPNGVRWWIYLLDESGTLGATRTPSVDVAASARDTPVQLSKARTRAYRWTVDDDGTIGQREVPVAEALHHYLPMVTPNGAEKVLLISNAGAVEVADLDAGGRIGKSIVLVRGTSQHKKLLVVDPRFPHPLISTRAKAGGDRY